MDIIQDIKDANALCWYDLWQFENYCPDQPYYVGFPTHTKVTRLALLISYIGDNDRNGIIDKYAKKAPEEINNVDQEIISALDLCVYKGYSEILKILLENCVNINQQWTSSERTIAHMSNFFDDKNIMKLLMEYDISMNIKDWTGSTPLHLCASKAYRRASKVMYNITLLNVLS